ncbi:PREDICTED: putative leucine-rich repeat-containing protein DDB_G0290503 [Polistes dominula]|uniref:Leucine-rich repeat-containing protein DDB_G0290503 n=1 Tax=Polistes dominula TaxID=743375 RepID=A0ABM1ICG3_POLDO|nr:PREDICTED: putative leucine-rich repeat-containing protein DDB_G0290503 [Polistes dominula]
MSYVEHGPRVFLIGRHNSNMPLAYGDYIVPQKRLEGRLKMYESCSDIRAWSSNPLETSQYFRELAEHTSPSGKIIPFNVVVENIIGLTSQAQNELQILHYQKEKQYKDNGILKASSKESFKMINKSISLPHLDSYLSIQFNREQNIQYNDRHYHRGFSLFNQIDSLSCKASYLLPKLKSIYFPIKSRNVERKKHFNVNNTNILTNLEDKYTQVACIECADISVQVIWDVYETGTQTDCLMEYTTSSETKISSIRTESQISTYKYDYRNNHEIERENIIIPANKYIRKSSYIESYQIENESESNSINESEFDNEFNDQFHKEIIIQKDSEIIAKEAEVEELEIMLKEKDETLSTLRRGLQLYTNTCIMEQLKMELSQKCDLSFLQSQEIEKLRLHIKDTTILLAEKDSLMKKVKEMEHLSKEAENYRLARDELKEALREKDELQKQNLEQKCILGDQEDEIKRLLILIQQMSSTHNDKQNICSRVKCEHDTCERTKRKLCIVSALMEELQRSKLENKGSLYEIENVKKHSKESICSSHLNYHFISSDSNSEVDESNAMMLKQTQTSQNYLLENTQFNWSDTEIINNTVMHEYTDFENHSNKDTSEPDSWKSAKTEVSILTINDNTNIENMIVEEVSRSLIRMQFLMKQLQVFRQHYEKCKPRKNVTSLNKESQETSIKNQLLDLSDEYIDKILTTQLKCSINKLNELSKALKEKIRMGEGDYVRPEKSEWDLIKENFKALDIELNEKNQLIKELQDTHKSNTVTLSAYITECNELKLANKNLMDIKNSLLKECNIRSDELDSLQEENTKLRKKLDDANEIIWENNKLMKELKDKREDDKHNFASKLLEYHTVLAKRENIINNLENENSSINDQLKYAENKIVSLNVTMKELHEQNNEMKTLDILYDYISKVENNKTRLESKSTKYKLELLNYENKDASTEIQHKQTKLQEDKLGILKNHNLKLTKNHDSFKTLMNLQKHFVHDKDENKSKVKHFFQNTTKEETISFDSTTNHTNKYKNILNSRYALHL